MFDKEKNISGENRKHIQFIRNTAKPLFESWGYQVEILRSDKDYMDVFNHIIEKPRKHMDHKGKKYGFPQSGTCSVQRDCKMRPINQFLKNLEEEYIRYVGICIDEPSRLESLHKNPDNISLLEKYGYTEEMARKKCEEYGLLSPSYELSKRGGCWFCPNAKLKEHQDIRKYDRKTWDRFVAMEKEKNLAYDKWNVFGESLEEREQKLSLEYRQITIFEYLNN